MSDLARAVQRPGAVDPRSFRIGVVKVAPAGGLCTVTVDGADNKLPVLSGVTLVVGDTALVARDGRSGGYVLGRLGTAPAPPPPAPDDVVTPVEPSVSRRVRTILPVRTGTYRGGSWRSGDDLVQGDYGGYGLNTGAAFYGNQLVALGADLARPYSAVLTYARDRGGDYAAQAPTLWTLTQRTRPAGAPTRGSSSAGTPVAVNRSASWELPSSWVAELLNGTRGGLGIYVPGSTPYMRLHGPSSASAAMALKVTYYA